MALKTLRVEVPTASAKGSKSSVSTLVIEGNPVQRFNEAVASQKEAEAIVAELKAEIIPLALGEYYSLATANPTNAPSSVQIKDETDAVLLFTSKDQYKAVDGAAAEALFEGRLGGDVNDYVQFVVAAKFDSKVFIDKNGDFSEATYKAFKDAIDKVAAKLGVASPISCNEVANTKPGFNQARYQAFSAVEDQKAIFEVCPNTVVLQPR